MDAESHDLVVCCGTVAVLRRDADLLLKSDTEVGVWLVPSL